MYKPDVSFKPRYRVEGLLTLLTPLRVGDGWTSKERGVYKRLKSERGQYEEVPIEVSTVCVDWEKKAFIPGSTIKGVLFSWLERNALVDAAAEAVFGAVNETGEPVRGGKAEFRDARLVRKSEMGPVLNAFQNPDGRRRYWSEKRGTCVEPRVAIDPRTKTADDQKLFHLEYVPEGLQFEVIVDLSMASEEELFLLIRAFEAFNDEVDRARIGAEQANYWGEVRWGVVDVEEIQAADVARWLKSGETILPFKTHAETGDQLKAKALALYHPRRNSRKLRIGVELQFQGALLVTDPSQERKEDQVGPDQPAIGHATVLRHDGSHFYLPSSSLRGSLRGQAARIWRTIAGKRAKWTATKQNEAKDAEQQKDLHAFYQLFGAAGWRSPIEITDFAVPNPRNYLQDFVAIDRFTGGGADGKKFSTRGLYRPLAKGSILVDLERLDHACGGKWQWAMLLLLFTLRDLIEGDVTFGFGAGKGYGECAASLSFGKSGDPKVDTVLESFPFTQPGAADVKQTLQEWQGMLLTRIEEAELDEHLLVQRRGA